MCFIFNVSIMSASIQSTDKITNKHSATSFIEQRVPANESAIRNASFDTVSATTLTTSDMAWNLEHFLSKPQMIGKNIPWHATDVPNTAIFNGYLPDLFLNVTNGIPSDFLNQVTFYRAGFRILVTFNASQFHAGKLILTWHPAILGSALASGWQNGYDSLFYETMLPHITVNAEQSASVEFDIPFSMLSSMYSRFDTAMDFSLGYLQLKVLNQLRTYSAAPQVVYVSVFATMISPEVHVPIASNATIQNPTFFRKDNLNPLFIENDTEAQGLETSFSNSSANTSKNSGAISQLTSAAASGASAFAQAETNPIGAIKSGIDATESAIAGMSSLFAGKFDYPNDTVNPETFMRMTTQNLALGGKAHNTSYELDLYPKQLHTVPFDYFGGTSDPMFVRDLVTIPSYVATYQVNETMMPQTQIFSFRVGPSIFGNGIAADTYVPSWLSSISSHFCLWRGSIRLYLQAVASRFHSVRLVGIWSPHASVNNPSTDLSSQTQSPYFVWDIQEDKEIVIDLPFNMNVPWLKTLALGVASGIDTTPQQSYLSYSGIFQLYVQNTLIGPADVNNVIDVNIWASAGPDFQLKVARDPNCAFAWSRYDAVTYNDTEPQGLDTDPEQGIEAITATELPTVPATVIVQNEDDQSKPPVDVLFLGEDYTHIKDLMRRYTKLYGANFVFPSTQPQNSRGYITLPVSPTILPDLLLGSNTSSAEGAGYFVTHLDHLSSHFAFWSGKLNFVVCVYSPNPCVVYITHFPDRYYDADSGLISKLDVNYNTLRFDIPNYATVMFNTTTQQAMPVTVPWTQVYPACLTDYDLTCRGNLIDHPLTYPRIDQWRSDKCKYFNGTLGINVDSFTTQNVYCEVFIGAGDDFQNYYRTAPPILSPLTTPASWPATTLLAKEEDVASSQTEKLVNSISSKLNISQAKIHYISSPK